VISYATPHAFRAALKARCVEINARDPRLGVDELQRQFAYDRVLARCFTGEDAQLWVLKGAGALLARLEGQARHSKDIDLYFADRDADTDSAVQALLAALDLDLSDHFRFEVTRISPLQEAAKGRRVHLTAYLGPRFASFHVDVVVGTAMSGAPDRVPPLTPLDFDGLERPPYRVFPVADHVADKLCAMLESHDRGDGTTRASSRVKDLVDIALIARSQSISGTELRAAVVAGAEHRGLALPEQFAVPEVAAWRAGYPNRAADVPGPVPTFDEAVDVAARLLDPVLAGTVAGRWDPMTRRWT
jgi:hypothetical protein